MAYRWTLDNLTDSTSEVLTRDPIDWDKGDYAIKRSERLRGIFHNYTSLVKFHCLGGGKSFIDTAYNTYGVNAKIQLTVEYDCDGSGTYDTLFVGMVSFMKYETTNSYTEVQIENGGLLRKLMAREATSVDLESAVSVGGESITPATTTNIELEPMDVFLKSRANLLSVAEFETSTLDCQVGVTSVGFFTQKFNTAQQELDIFTPPDTSEAFGVGLSTSNTYIAPIFTADSNDYGYPLTCLFNIKVNASVTSTPRNLSMSYTYNLRLILRYGTELDTATEVIIFNGSYPGFGSATINTGNINYTNASVPLERNDKVWLYWVVGSFLPTASDGQPDNVVFTFNYNAHDELTDSVAEYLLESNTTFPASNCKSVLVYEALGQTIDAITDGDNNLYSEFYGREDSQKQTYAQDGKGSKLAITNGLNIREFPNEKIYCNFQELFDSLDCLHNIGIGYINGKLRVEPMEFFFDSTTKLLTLPNVPNVTKKLLPAMHYSKLMFGYAKWETEFKKGIDEPNTRHEYSTIIDGVNQSVYDKLCQYIASTYGIEITRRQAHSLYPELDYKYDNDNFFISVIRYDYGSATAYLTKKYVDAFSSGTGMTALTTAFNLDLTPGRMLQAHLNKVTGALQIVNGDISFVKGEGNTELAVAMDATDNLQQDYNGQVLGESDSIAWNDSDARNIVPLYIPESYEFEYPLSYTDFKVIQANPYGYIEFYEFADTVLSGFIMDAVYSMKTGLTKFTLIRKP